MCRGCWEEYGSPMILSDRVCIAAELIKKVYKQEGGGVGGNLHCVVDDWNLEDEHIQWCIDKTGTQRDFLTGEEYDLILTTIERECAGALMAMTIQERASALALSEGWLHEAIKEAECSKEQIGNKKDADFA